MSDLLALLIGMIIALVVDVASWFGLFLMAYLSFSMIFDIETPNRTMIIIGCSLLFVITGASISRFITADWRRNRKA